MSYKWNYMVYNLLTLTSFTQNNASEIHPYCYVHQQFVLFFSFFCFLYCVDDPQFAYHLLDRMAASFSFPPVMYESSSCSESLSALIIVRFVYFSLSCSHSDRCIMVSQHAFNLHFHNG